MSRELPARKAEQITATVLFCDLVGFSRISAEYGPERAYLAVTELLRLLDAIARRHGGSVDKYQGDKLMAVFGYPLPLEDPARAAVSAALEMRQQVADYNRESGLAIPLETHLGINTGELVGGDIRGPVVREFHVLGDAVNVAARLTAKTPTGAIWAGERTQQATEEAFVWKPLDLLLFKGKSRRVAAYALEAARGRVARDRLGFDQRLVAELIGREAALAALRERLAELARGRGGALLLTGEEGSGKSRLLAALGESPEAEGLTVLQARASSVEREPGIVEERVFSAAAEGPVLAVLEDAQWMSPRAIQRVERLLAAARELPVLLIGTARPGPVTERLKTAIEKAGFQGAPEFELTRLDRASSAALVRAALGAAADEETVQLVIERGGDLPGPLLQAAFLAPALRSEREQAKQRAERTSEAERRRAVVVFADITGFTKMTEKVGAEAAYPVVAACLEILDQVARSQGGTVDHYLGDCVMALFGVPRALEDAPRAALNAAIEMRRRIRDFREQHALATIDVHIGVATGHGIAGDISGPLIREFAVMGDHVDRADVLTHAAESGEIMVDEETHRAAREIFEFRESEALELPGSAEPQPTWELTSTTPRLHRARIGAERRVFSELVGREAELARLGELLEALAQGRGGVASLVAEAGLGKSRLLAELRKRESRALWLEGRSISNGRNLSYHPIADLVRSAAGVADEDDAPATRAKLDAFLRSLLPERAAAETAPLLANLVGAVLSPEERERLAVIQGDALEKLVRGAVLQILRAASGERPVVVLMEDLHWADLSSIELIESLLRLAEERPVLFLNAFRPGFEQTSGRVLALAREKLAERHVQIELEPLGTAAARAIVKNLFRGGDVPQRIRAAIEERARGNPFYIEEVVRSLLDAGALVAGAEGLLVTEKLESMVIPDSVQAAILARVDGLDLRRRSLLQAASVIGQVFHRDVLESVVGDREALGPLLEGLEDSEFIEPTDRTAGVEFAFKHPLIQEVTYDSMLEARRRGLHLEVARAARQVLNDRPGYCAMLAYHYTKAGDAENADEFLFRAGDEAARAAASNEALHFFEQASALYTELHGKRGDPARRALLEKNLAIALLNRGRLIEAVDHFDLSTSLMGSPAPRGGLAMGANFAANLGRVMGRLYLRRRPWGRRAATERERELVDVMFRRAMAQSTSAPTRFLVDSVALLRRVSAVDPHTIPESAAMYAGVVAIFSYGGLSFGLGRRFLDLASELAQGGAIEERFLYFQTLRFLHHLLAGDWSDQHAIESEAVDRGLREGRFWEASTYTNLNGVKQVYQGNFEEARRCIAKLAEIADLYQHDLAASAQDAVTAYLHVERREFAPALATLERYYDEHAEATFNLLALGTRAKVSALMGDADAAESNLRRAEAVLAQVGRVAPYHQSGVRSARYLADLLALERAVLRGDGSVGEALRRARKSRAAAISTAQRVAFRLPEALRLAGREAWLEEQGKEALGWWQQAAACCERLGARPELARTLAEAGAALGAGLEGAIGGRDASACRSEAIRLFEALGLAFDRTQIADAA